MSNFAGVTFTKQAVSPSDDAIVRRALLSDGILTGCAFTYSGSTLTMAAGHLMVCGRQIKHPTSQNWAVVDATSGFARLVLTIDMTRTATKDTFDQVLDSIEYASAVDGFVNLEQSDINGSGTRYQIAACVVSLGAGGITGIVSQLERAEAGGSGGLNFNVVGSVTQPSDPKENMIWVNTTETVTAWVFSAEQPAEASEGLAWFRTGAASAAAFNALKKNGIMVYPISAMQYVGGAWADIVAKSYIGGTWVDWWNGELYDTGNEFASITGGWVEYSGNTAGAVIEEAASYLKLTTGKHGTNSSIETKKLIDMSEYDTLVLSGEINSATTNCGWGLRDADGKQVAWTTSEYTLDISKLNGMYKPYLQVRNSSESIKMTKMQMVR